MNVVLRRGCGPLLAAVLLAGCAGSGAAPDAATTADAAAAPAAPAAYHGREPAQPVDRPSFVLTDTAGRAFDFAARTGGRPTLLYFGYTSCPDECPTAMADIAAALRSVEPEVREQVQVVFVTTDPQRDTAAVLDEWLAPFGAQVVGLRGTDEQVAAAQRAQGLPPAEPGGVVPTLPGKPNEHEHQPGTVPHSHAGPLGYAVEHTNMIFAYDAADRLAVMYPAGVTPADIAADLPVLAEPPRQEES